MKKEIVKELDDLSEIFDGMFFDGEEVQCFRFIKKIVDNSVNIEDIEKETKERMKKQLNESLEWLREFNIKIMYKHELESYF